MIFKSCGNYIDNYNNDEKKQALNLGSSFTCYENTFDSKKYLVSKSNGWSEHQEFFKKDDLLLAISKCTQEK